MIVDKSDMPFLSDKRLYLTPQGYAVYAVGHKKELVHRIHFKDSLVVDHINGNKLDNRRANLRSCSGSLNSMNRGVQKNNTTGFKGVVRYARDRWRARVGLNRKYIHCGVYSSPEEAAKAYNLVASFVFGEYAYLNQV